MLISLFNSRFGSALSVAIDYWTVRKTLGWNPLKHWQYLRNPKGRSHAEWCFDAEAAVWYVDNLYRHKTKEFEALRKLSELQIYSAIYEVNNSHNPLNFTNSSEKIAELIKRGLLSLMFSASEKDKCVRFKLIYKEEGKWTDYKIKGNTLLEKAIISRCDRELNGMDYGYKSLAGFLTPLNLITSSGKAKICSGVVAQILSWYWLDIKPRNGWPAVDPNLLDLYLSEHIRVSCLDYIPLRTN